jgi:hypothetical protein
VAAKPALSVKDRIKGAKRARRTHRINLRGDLVAEIERLNDELVDAQDRERSDTSKRLAQQSPSLAIAKRIEKLRAEMADDWLELTLEAQTFADWQEFKNGHPAREDNDYDKIVGLDFDALANDFMPRCVVEPELDEEDWDGLWDKCAPADLRDMAAVAFSLHEQTLDVPKSRLASALTARNGEDSEPRRLGE